MIDLPMQEQLPLIITKDVEHNFYPLFAPTSYGFFALSNLHLFCHAQIDPLLGLSSDTTVILDFSSVKVWDISALLWLTLSLQHYKKEGLRFQIKLPEPQLGMNGKEKDEYQRSADFLRRWRFDTALLHVGELEDILVPEQHDYFSSGPEVYYQEGREILTPQGLLEKLLSNRLVEIRDLTERSGSLGGRQISDFEVEKCIREFNDAKIGNVLANNCDISVTDAECFAEHLVTECLLNMQQHPNATTGLLSVSILGRSKELILAVADNGDSIPSTILSVYNKNHNTSYSLKSLQKLSTEIRASIIHFATQPYVSRKPMITEEDIGLGLTYIKEDTIGKFKGKVRIISNSVQALYKDNIDGEPHSVEWKHCWRGNLLRISIPLKK